MRIYLDHNAGAPLRPEAREAMLAVLGPPANPSSAHREGARARSLLEEARADVAALVGARPPDVVFTSGATEANNLALRGVLAARGPRGGSGDRRDRARVRAGDWRVRSSGPARRSRSSPSTARAASSVSDVVDACDARTALVSIGLANGEVGTVAPVGAIAAALRPRGILVHTDAAQAAGRLPIDVARWTSTCSRSRATSSAARPVRAPSGCVAERRCRRSSPAARRSAGCAPGPRTSPRWSASRRRRGQRRREVEAAGARMAALTERLWDGLRARIPGVARHGATAGPRLPNTLNIRIPGCAGESLLVLLDLAGVAVSLGSACAAGAAEPSHVLRAMGLGDDAARSALRLSLGPATTEAEIDAVIDLLPRLVRDVRARGRAGAAA